MGFFDDSFFEAGEGFTRVCDGEYLLTIKAAEAEVKHWKDDLRIKWQFRIKDGPEGIGQTLKMTTILQPTKMFSLSRLLKALGFDIEKLRETDFANEAEFTRFVDKIASAVEGKEFGGLVVESKPDAQNRRYSNVNQTYAAEEYSERSKANVVGPRPESSGGRHSTAGDDEDADDLAQTVKDW